MYTNLSNMILYVLICTFYQFVYEFVFTILIVVYQFVCKNDRQKKSSVWKKESSSISRYAGIC